MCWNPKEVRDIIQQDRFHSGTKVVELVEWVAILDGAEEVKQHLFDTDDIFEHRKRVY